MDSREIGLYMAYDNLNPPDDPYWRTGLLASMMECAWSGKKSKLEPEKYMPKKKENKKSSGHRAQIKAFAQMQKARGIQ